MAGRERGGGRSKGRAGKSAARHPSVRVRRAKGRKPSSTRWLHRQLNDPYVAESVRQGYRSRAAWKLIEIDRRFGLLRSGAAVLDLGAAPGGWAQVAAERVRSAAGRAGGRGRVIAVDLQEMAPIEGAAILRLDIGEPEQAERLVEAAGAGCDVVLSDMAIAATGHRPTDQIRNQALAELACEIGRRVLRPGGALVVKVFHGGGAAEMMAALKRDFSAVRTFKPPASRSESAETYVVAKGFRNAWRAIR